MNRILKKEIISHIINLFGIPSQNSRTTGITSMVELSSDQFIINKNILAEDGTLLGKVFGSSAKIENSELKVISYIFLDDITEYVLIICLDDLSPCSLRLSNELEDYGSLSILVDKDWVDTGTAHQAKLLSTIEGLSNIFVQWNKMNDYNKMYEYLISSIKHNETKQS